MNITRQVNKKLYENKKSKVLTTNKNYTCEYLLEKIQEYTRLLKVYKEKGINRIAIILNDDFDINSISLVLALISCNITPVLIEENIGENIKGILEKEDIKLAFYNSNKKPYYLEKIRLIVAEDETGEYFITKNPYINVKDKRKIKNMNWYLQFMKNKKDESTIKIYNKSGSIQEYEILEEEILEYAKNLSQNAKSAYTTIPLFKKEGLLYMISNLLNATHTTCIDWQKAEKNITKILKRKPEIISLDERMYLELEYNSKFDNIDFSFLKNVILDGDSKYVESFNDLLLNKGFYNQYIVTEKTIDKIHVKK